MTSEALAIVGFLVSPDMSGRIEAEMDLQQLIVGMYKFVESVGSSCRDGDAKRSTCFSD